MCCPAIRRRGSGRGAQCQSQTVMNKIPYLTRSQRIVDRRVFVKQNVMYYQHCSATNASACTVIQFRPCHHFRQIRKVTVNRSLLSACVELTHPSPSRKIRPCQGHNGISVIRRVNKPALSKVQANDRVQKAVLSPPCSLPKSEDVYSSVEIPSTPTRDPVISITHCKQLQRQQGKHCKPHGPCQAAHV
jgi:hypothetical protein